MAKKAKKVDPDMAEDMAMIGKGKAVKMAKGMAKGNKNMRIKIK